ncbi:MAG: hypothetical protein M3Z26_12125 [Bacteroidota bacterium]|nr:hypothetical protein [Bacteroidota bacterium]
MNTKFTFSAFFINHFYPQTLTSCELQKFLRDDYVNYIPRRWPYSSTEILTNPQPEQSVTTADRVWWDTP